LLEDVRKSRYPGKEVFADNLQALAAMRTEKRFKMRREGEFLLEKFLKRVRH